MSKLFKKKVMDIFNGPSFEKRDMEVFNKHCKKYGYTYVPIVIPTKKHVFAIGDIHGDYKLTLEILINVIKVIDKDLNWIKKDCLVIQVGDQVDGCRPNGKRCDEPHISTTEYGNSELAEDIKVLELFSALSIKALHHNSQIVSLFGNHELMNTQGNMNYVSYSDVMKFATDSEQNYEEALNNRKEQFEPGNKYAKLLACSRTPVAIVGNFMFVHAGIVKPFLDKLDINNTDDLYKISYLIRQWLLKLIDKDNIIDIINSAPYSLFWTRIMDTIPLNTSIDSPICDENLRKVMDIFNLSGLIVGHCPQSFSNNRSGINSTCSNKLFRIDVGASFAFDDAAESVSSQSSSPGPITIEEQQHNLSHINKNRQAQVLYIHYENNKDKEEQCVKILTREDTLFCDDKVKKR